MSANRKKSPAIHHKAKEEVNKKALIWVGSVFGAVVIAMALLLIFNN